MLAISFADNRPRSMRKGCPTEAANRCHISHLLFAPFLAIDGPMGSVLDCHIAVHIRNSYAAYRSLCRARAKERKAHLMARGKALSASDGLAPRVSTLCPLLVSVDCGTIQLRTSCTTHHADRSYRIPGEQLGALSRIPTLQIPKRFSAQRPKEQCRRQRPRQAAPLQLAVGNRVFGPLVARVAQSVWARTSRATSQGTSFLWSAELGVRGTQGVAN